MIDYFDAFLAEEGSLAKEALADLGLGLAGGHEGLRAFRLGALLGHRGVRRKTAEALQ
jgi:hypothetical protein